MGIWGVLYRWNEEYLCKYQCSMKELKTFINCLNWIFEILACMLSLVDNLVWGAFISSINYVGRIENITDNYMDNFWSKSHLLIFMMSCLVLIYFIIFYLLNAYYHDVIAFSLWTDRRILMLYSIRGTKIFENTLCGPMDESKFSSYIIIYFVDFKWPEGRIWNFWASHKSLLTIHNNRYILIGQTCTLLIIIIFIWLHGMHCTYHSHLILLP